MPGSPPSDRILNLLKISTAKVRTVLPVVMVAAFDGHSSGKRFTSARKQFVSAPFADRELYGTVRMNSPLSN